jgi:hypothetical protein
LHYPENHNLFLVMVFSLVFTYVTENLFGE